MKRTAYYSLALTALLTACAGARTTPFTSPTVAVAPLSMAPRPPAVEPVITSKAMVVSAHPEATRIGVAILQKGGNAYDAAVAVQLALAVALPAAGNIGGGGFLLYRGADGQTGALDFRETAPAAATRDMYLDPKGNVAPGRSTLGHLAAGVPGTVAGMAALHEKLGKLPWREVVQPAIDLAANGLALTSKEAAGLNNVRPELARFTPTSAYLKAGGTWKEGDIIKYPELAQTLTRIRDQGRAGFYEGPTADLIVAEMERGHGLISAQDLRQYEPRWREPLHGRYRGYDVLTFPPPSSGGVALLQMLQMLQPYDLATLGWHTPASVHLITEAERRVYADRATYLGDPDFGRVPVPQLLDSTYNKQRMATTLPARATPSAQVAAGAGLPGYESDQTTHYDVVDAQGNAVSCTTTLNGGYGSKVVVGGAGFLLNNEMDDFSSKPGVPNSYGLVGGTANAIQPGKRMLSSMTPTILTRRDQLYLVVGTPGGSTIITSVLQAILNVVDYGLNPQQAVAAPRLHHQWLPDQLDAERDALIPAAADTLRAHGYPLKVSGGWGRLDLIQVLPDGRLAGGADPRGDDAAGGY